MQRRQRMLVKRKQAVVEISTSMSVLDSCSRQRNGLSNTFAGSLWDLRWSSIFLEYFVFHFYCFTLFVFIWNEFIRCLTSRLHPHHIRFDCFIAHLFYFSFFCAWKLAAFKICYLIFFSPSGLLTSLAVQNFAKTPYCHHYPFALYCTPVVKVC